MRRRFISLSVLALGLVTSVTDVSLEAAPAQIAFVANANDSGPGIFPRRDRSLANANTAVTRIQFAGRLSTIALQQTVWFTGTQDLTIGGAGSTLDGTNTRGPRLPDDRRRRPLRFNLTVRNAPAEGISVEVPHFATGHGSCLAGRRQYHRQRWPRCSGERSR